MTDLFGVRGRAWLAALELPPDERLTLDAAVRIDAVLSEQVAAAERAIAERGRRRPAGPTAAHDPGDRARDRGLDPRGRGRHRPVRPAGQARVLSRPRPAGPPVGRPAGRCAATSAGRARPMPGACCARPPTRRSARRDRSPGSMPGSRRGGVAASRSSRRPASSRCSCGTCSPRTRTAGSRRRRGRPSSSAQLDRLAGRVRDAAVATGSDWFQPRPGSGKAARRA